MEKAEDDEYAGRYKDKADKAVIGQKTLGYVVQLYISQNSAYDHHRNGSGAAADIVYGIGDEHRQFKGKEHQDKANKNRHDTGMGHKIFYNRFAVGFCVKAKAGRPQKYPGGY